MDQSALRSVCIATGCNAHACFCTEQRLQPKSACVLSPIMWTLAALADKGSEVQVATTGVHSAGHCVHSAGHCRIMTCHKMVMVFSSAVAFSQGSRWRMAPQFDRHPHISSSKHARKALVPWQPLAAPYPCRHLTQLTDQVACSTSSAIIMSGMFSSWHCSCTAVHPRRSCCILHTGGSCGVVAKKHQMHWQPQCLGGRGGRGMVACRVQVGY